MKYRLALGLLATVVLAYTPARAVDQADIDRAIEKGVKALRAMQRPGGSWPHEQIGATALAGLTLLECGAKEDDNEVLSAASAVRGSSISLTHTYSIALSILFLDRLGDARDVPLIQSLTVRLLAGQDPRMGGWSYNCPQISPAEMQRLRKAVEDRKEDAGRRDGTKPETKRKSDDLPPEIRDQLQLLERGGAGPQRGPGGPPGFPPMQPAFMGGPMMIGGPGDNSNTQFAALGLWVGHRSGVPIERALTRMAQRFRTTQGAEGGWAYMAFGQPAGMPANNPMGFGMEGTTATMTCAGLICLSIADGATLELSRKRKPDAKLPDIEKDENLKKGLQALGAVVGSPKGNWRQRQPAPGGFPGAPFAPADGVGGRTYYFLWSLERVAVALDLQTIGKKDWYSWGAEILLENQMPDGSWSGEYSQGGVDTCFALLFLKRANLVRDLTASIKGKVTDPAERELRGGKPRGRGTSKMLSGIESRDARPIEKPLLKAMRPESVQLADKLLKAGGPERDRMLEEMEDAKGPMYTEALAHVIPQLDGETKSKARQALADRLTRMKDETLEDYFHDSDPEIRRAAALAAGQKDSKDLVPRLIALLRDPESSVVRAARASLKSLTAQDFGPPATATREERDQAVLKWLDWWSEKRKR